MKVSTFFSLLVSACSLVTVSCTQNTSTDKSTAVADSTKTETAQEPIFKDEKYNGVYEHYTHLKNALISANVQEAKTASDQLNNELKGIAGCENTAKAVAVISGLTDIEKQRKDFIPVSSDIVAMLKHADMTSGRIYVDYCPMADEGKGAYWLSSNKVIENPYYGDKMMTCGEVKEVIEKK
jgi:Cu(I)/Ag(I) efflux system membrane fusion protein